MRRNRIIAALCLLFVLMGMSCSGGGNGGVGPPPADAPRVTGINPTTVSPGDTLTISGSHFSTTAGENTVTFTNQISGTAPFSATSAQLRVVVDSDATGGPVTVTTVGGSAKSPQSLSVTRGI